MSDDDLDCCAQAAYEAWRAIGARLYGRRFGVYGALSAIDRVKLRDKVRWALSRRPTMKDPPDDQLFTAVARAIANSLATPRPKVSPNATA